LEASGLMGKPQNGHVLPEEEVMITWLAQLGQRLIKTLKPEEAQERQRL
jgi:hypothetical protein